MARPTKPRLVQATVSLSRRFCASREMSTDQQQHLAMKPETEFSLSVLLLAALAVPIHSMAMSLIRSAGIVSMLYVPAVVIAVWIVVWRCRAGLHERPPIGLLITLPPSVPCWGHSAARH